MRRVLLVIPFVVSAGTALAVGPKLECSTRPPKGTPKSELAVLAKVSEADARKAALAAKGISAGASVAESELEIESGCLVWSFDLKIPGKPGVQEVMIDAGTAKVLSSIHESPKKEAAERAKDAAPRPN